MSLLNNSSFPKDNEDKLVNKHHSLLDVAKGLVGTLIQSKCGLCLETLIQPVFLPCGHTFCHECLQNQIDESNPDTAGKCAVCRFKFAQVDPYNPNSRNQVKENLRPHKEMSQLIELLGGLEYQTRIKTKERIRMISKILDMYCQSPRASQIQNIIKQRFQISESLCLSEMMASLKCSKEEFYYHLLIYSGWIESNKHGFSIWNQRYYFFRNHLIDTRNLGELTPLLLIDTQITGLSMEEKFYLSLIAAGKSHWNHHRHLADCEGVRMIHFQIEKMEKEEKTKSGFGFQPDWISEYRSNECPDWMKKFHLILEQLDSEEKAIIAGKQEELRAKEEAKRIKKEQKQAHKEKKREVRNNLVDIIKEENQNEEKDDEKDEEKNEEKEIPAWKSMNGFNEDPNLLQTRSNNIISESEKKGLSCRHCNNYPCDCSRCVGCSNRLMECACEGDGSQDDSADDS